MSPRPARLRRWQAEALERLARHPHPDFLAVATPGAGKTSFALAAICAHLSAAPSARVVVVAPTAHLKAQWAAAAAERGVQVSPRWTARDGLAPGFHGVVVTYQQVATSAPALARLAEGAIIVLDEVHHAGEDRAWGDALLAAFAGADRRVALSGTPFRSDTQAIPFVRYAGDEAYPDYTYGYGDALADRGVVRPVRFPRVDGEMEWVGADGSHHRGSFAEHMDVQRANQRLRTALSPDGQWLPEVLALADERLTSVRATHPRAGGLVIAADQEHARATAALLTARTGRAPAVALSDDPGASDRIAAFAASDEPWIVAVRMISEGVDVPRLRVGVFATTTTTELFFRQAVGRLVRWTRGVRNQRAWLYIPDDHRLRTHAVGIAEERRHSLQRREVERADEEVVEEGEREQLSLFTAISSVATSAFDADMPDGEELEAGEATLVDDVEDDDGWPTLPTAPAPPGGVAEADGDVGVPTTSTAERMATLRASNAARASTLADLTGQAHKQVNAALNREAGIAKITAASEAQLRARLTAADRWLRRLAAGRAS